MFIELPILLRDNNPDDKTDYDSLGIDPEYEKQWMDCLINLKDIQRINSSDRAEGNTVLWTFDGSTYYTSLHYDEVKKMVIDAL